MSTYSPPMQSSGTGILKYVIAFLAIGLVCAALVALAQMPAGEAGAVAEPESVEPEAVILPDWMEYATVPAQIVIDPAYSHADAKHPTEAPVVRDCLAKKGGYLNFLVARDIQRFLRVCITDDNQVGFQVVDKHDDGQYYEVTCYIRQGLNNLGDILRYIANQGYSRWKGLIE